MGGATLFLWSVVGYQRDLHQRLALQEFTSEDGAQLPMLIVSASRDCWVAPVSAGFPDNETPTSTGKPSFVVSLPR